MPHINFSHSKINDGFPLVIPVGPNNVSWGYNMNTAVYPTYGGEVVQILSAYTDDISIGGEVKTYAAMEKIYHWFLTYFQLATQGNDGPRYNQESVRMSYPYRNWSWKVRPKALPEFTYGLEVVAPSWQVTCAVVDDDVNVQMLNVEAARNGLERLHAGIGYDAIDPFSSPFPEEQVFNPEKTRKFFDKSSDYFNDLIKSYYEGDYEELLGNIGAKPAFLNPEAATNDGESDQEGRANKKKPNKPKPGSADFDDIGW